MFRASTLAKQRKIIIIAIKISANQVFPLMTISHDTVINNTWCLMAYNYVRNKVLLSTFLCCCHLYFIVGFILLYLSSATRHNINKIKSTHHLTKYWGYWLAFANHTHDNSFSNVPRKMLWVFVQSCHILWKRSPSFLEILLSNVRRMCQLLSMLDQKLFEYQYIETLKGNLQYV